MAKPFISKRIERAELPLQVTIHYGPSRTSKRTFETHSAFNEWFNTFPPFVHVSMRDAFGILYVDTNPARMYRAR